MLSPCLDNFTSEKARVRQDGCVKRAWTQIISIWVVVAILTSVVTLGTDRTHALAWYGAILAGSISTVCLIHLIKASASGIVKELVYVAGGSYLMLALASVYLFF